MSEFKSINPNSEPSEKEKEHRINDYLRLKYEYSQSLEKIRRLESKLKIVNETDTSQEQALHKHSVSVALPTPATEIWLNAPRNEVEYITCYTSGTE
jgi:hypothetical protein